MGGPEPASRGSRPRVGFRWPRTPVDGLRQVLPVRRWTAAIVVCAALFAVMCVPLFIVGLPVLDSDGGLIKLGVSLFRGFWLLGWAVGAALPALALAVLLLGREVVMAQPGLLHLRLEILGFGLGADYAAAEVRKLRPANGDVAQGTAWRGDHLVFDYHDTQVQLGSDLDAATASDLRFALQQVLAQAAPPGFKLPAAPPIAAAAIDAPAAPSRVPESAPAARLALLGLVAANLLPLVGVLAWHWQVGEIMLVYWAESVIIGLINIAKLVVIGRWAAAFYAPFFLAHYGAFMAMHLVFVMLFFLRGPTQGGDMPLSEVVNALAVLWPALLGLSLSHVLSFAQNFIARGEYTRIKLAEQMNAPYKRVFVMQFTIIIGGMLTVALGTPLPALVLLIALKLVVDVNAHRAERRRAQPAPADAA